MEGHAPLHAGHPAKDLSQQTHRRLIGYLGLFLPALLYVFAALRPTPPLPRWELLDSVSAYYYTGAVGIFVGVLFALSLFLFSYPGYAGEIADRLVGCLGGASALGVALCPTAPPPGLSAPPWWYCVLRTVHYISATLLFVSFILFSVWLFRRSNIRARKDRPADKRMRDDVCLACGIVMIGAVLWAMSALITKGPIFLPEAIAIAAFAISWLVKGEAYQPVMQAYHRARAALAR